MAHILYDKIVCQRNHTHSMSKRIHTHVYMQTHAQECHTHSMSKNAIEQMYNSAFVRRIKNIF